MSVFTVKLNRQNGAGYVTDSSVTSGVSAQRSMYVAGPRGVHRLLKDGETFTSSNYWLRYAPTSEGGSLSESDAFIHVVTDDGTPYSDTNPEANKFARVVNFTVAAGTTFSATANQYDILGTLGGVALYTEITTDQAVVVRFNGSSNAEYALAEGTQTFDNGDMPLASLSFSNMYSGAVDAEVQVLMSVQIQSND